MQPTEGEIMDGEVDLRASAEDEAALSKKTLKFTLKGLYIELSSLAAVLLALLSLLLQFISAYIFGLLFGLLFVICCLWVIIAPLIGCVWGFCTLFAKHKSRGSIAVSVISFALPIVVVTVTVLLLSTGAVVIRLM